MGILNGAVRIGWHGPCFIYQNDNGVIVMEAGGIGSEQSRPPFLQEPILV
ncbi:MAG: hypothetical protein KC588_12380 [Nitrospira sp.]|nr:hypothetical protein [Nitrospira sp.]